MKTAKMEEMAVMVKVVEMDKREEMVGMAETVDLQAKSSLKELTLRLLLLPQEDLVAKVAKREMVAKEVSKLELGLSYSEPTSV